METGVCLCSHSCWKHAHLISPSLNVFLRFWYERPGQFSLDQLQQLRHSSLARVICDNSDNTDHVPRDVLVLQPESQFSVCDDLPTVDLSLWADCESWLHLFILNLS